LLKYFQLNGRFPQHHRDVPGPVLAFLGERLSVPPTAWFDYDLRDVEIFNLHDFPPIKNPY